MSEQIPFGLDRVATISSSVRLHAALADMTPESLQSDVTRYTRPFPLSTASRGEFKAFVKPGDNDHMIAFVPELGAWKNTDYIGRNLAVAAMVDPDAWVVMLRHGNPFPGRSPLALGMREWTNYTKAGVERLKVVSGKLGDPAKQTIFGNSLGGSTALEYSADRDTPATATIVGDVVTIPRTPKRGVKNLLDDSAKGGGDAREALSRYFPGVSLELAEEFQAQNSPEQGEARLRRLIALHPIEMALQLHTLATSTRSLDHIEAALEKPTAAVAHLWSTEGYVSPLDTNRAIQASLVDHPRYTGHEIEGNHLDVVVNCPVLGYGAIRANQLRAA